MTPKETTHTAGDGHITTVDSPLDQRKVWHLCNGPFQPTETVLASFSCSESQ